MRKNLYFLLLGIVCLLYSYDIHATHLRAGDITARVIDLKTRTYEFTLTLYRDSENGVDQLTATLNFGDGTPCQTVDLLERIAVSPATERLTYKFVHSFAGDGNYAISFNEENRNGNINNINDGNSVQISFYVETLLVIDAFNGLNNTPVLLVPPIDEGATGEIYIHNPGAFDPDGDSLSYKMTVSKAFNEGEGGCGDEGGTPFVVPNYKLPNHDQFYTTPFQDIPREFSLDPVSGTLIWNAPGKEGEYNMAFIVEEWRKINGRWVRLGYVTRDMQVTISATDNNPPELIIPKDTCVVAGTILEAEIIATDPDTVNGTARDMIILESFSGIYTLPSNPAKFDVNPNKVNPVKGNFFWQTDSSHIREKPYQVIFKAKDIPPTPPALVDLQTWNITVVGPAPVLNTATPQPGKQINLTWDVYKFPIKDAIIQVYRKGGPYNFTPSNCELGIPEGSGYQLIGTTAINETSYQDKDNLKRGGQYCYRLVVQFPTPGGGVSYASNEVCAELKIDVPVITKVSVETTSETAGEIRVEWIQPLELDVVAFPAPYKYEVYRVTGMGGSQNQVLISTINDFDSTSIVDTGLNTERNPYTYKVLMYSKDVALDTSDAASSVRLAAAGEVNAINLSWTYQVPWTNTTFNIYRQDLTTGAFNLIGNTSEPAFVDNGIGGITMIPEEEYCYYVEAQGTYNNPLIPDPLINLSQITCQSPRDTIPPCVPILSIAPIDCDNFNTTHDCNHENYFNTLTWTDVRGPECKDDIAFYKLYYSFRDSTALEAIAPEVLDTFFLHKDNPNFYAGYYAVTAVDRSGNESAKSNIVYNDNCPYVEFPNVITPNGDKYNEVFKPNDSSDEPQRCARFVETIEFIVVNRWGNVVYDSKKSTNSGGEGSSLINWNGTTNAGKELAEGVYFYEAKVKFITRNPGDAAKTFKGWVQVLR